MTKLKLIDVSKPGSPPRPLLRHGMALWNRIVRDYDISDEAGREFLALACEATDRAQQCAALIAECSVAQITETTGRITVNPLCKLELESRAQAAKLLERLGLNTEPAQANVGRPAGTWSYEKASKSSA